MSGADTLGAGPECVLGPGAGQSRTESALADLQNQLMWRAGEMCHVCIFIYINIYMFTHIYIYL